MARVEGNCVCACWHASKLVVDREDKRRRISFLIYIKFSAPARNSIRCHSHSFSCRSRVSMDIGNVSSIRDREAKPRAYRSWMSLVLMGEGSEANFQASWYIFDTKQVRYILFCLQISQVCPCSTPSKRLTKNADVLFCLQSWRDTGPGRHVGCSGSDGDRCIA